MATTINLSAGQNYLPVRSELQLMIVVGNYVFGRVLFPAFGNTLAATRTATKVKAGLLLKRPVMATYDDDLGCMVEVINLRIIKGATVNSLKLTDYGFGVIGF
jgi:hypothetical protein